MTDTPDLRERVLHALRTTRVPGTPPQLDLPAHHEQGESGHVGWCALCARDTQALADAVLAVLPAPAPDPAPGAPRFRRPPRVEDRLWRMRRSAWRLASRAHARKPMIFPACEEGRHTACPRMCSGLPLGECCRCACPCHPKESRR
ncbi:hypothetical protein [Streptomyces sp. NEAU-H3]|uniref:hypothetical protein n=1 Tax=Streptomyces sp. NEAU-H3 TaxID=2720636 RepID=UPI001FD83CC7|nr:hypothetical protein [Streptomyces sp. NEAU-H3]